MSIIKFRNIYSILSSVETIDGAGVRLRRYIGTPYINYLDPFLLLDEIKTDNSTDYFAGFPSHPHRGFQTLTYMVDGKFEHKDSTGSSGVLNSGGLQWMNAGSGVIHSEMPLMDNRRLWCYQMWLNLSKEYKWSDPFYHNFKTYEIKESDFKLNLLSGHVFNEEQKNFANYPVIYLDIRLQKGAVFKYEIPESMNAFCLVSEGEIIFNPNKIRLNSHKIAILDEGNYVSFEAVEDSVVLLGAGLPVKESIARWGPFVMNTKEEIYQAIEDYQNGCLVRKKALDL
jgi:redox-sensitive bicupin YhaK (pirin superfamily)